MINSSATSTNTNFGTQTMAYNKYHTTHYYNEPHCILAAGRGRPGS